MTEIDDADDLRAWISRQLASAPPITDEQRESHAEILACTRRRLAAEKPRVQQPLGETA